MSVCEAVCLCVCVSLCLCICVSVCQWRSVLVFSVSVCQCVCVPQKALELGYLRLLYTYKFALKKFAWLHDCMIDSKVTTCLSITCIFTPLFLWRPFKDHLQKLFGSKFNYQKNYIMGAIHAHTHTQTHTHTHTHTNTHTHTQTHTHTDFWA